MRHLLAVEGVEIAVLERVDELVDEGDGGAVECVDGHAGGRRNQGRNLSLRNVLLGLSRCIKAVRCCEKVMMTSIMNEAQGFASAQPSPS